MQANMIFHLHSTICYTPNEPSSRGKDTVQEVTKLPKTLCKVSLFNDLTGYSLHLLIAPGPALRQTAMLAACQKNAVFLSPRWVCTHRSLFAPVLSSAEIIPRGDRGDWETKSEFDTSEQQLFEASGKTNLCWECAMETAFRYEACPMVWFYNLGVWSTPRNQCNDTHCWKSPAKLPHTHLGWSHWPNPFFRDLFRQCVVQEFWAKSAYSLFMFSQ